MSKLLISRLSDRVFWCHSFHRFFTALLIQRRSVRTDDAEHFLSSAGADLFRPFTGKHRTIFFEVVPGRPERMVPRPLQVIDEAIESIKEDDFPPPV